MLTSLFTKTLLEALFTSIIPSLSHWFAHSFCGSAQSRKESDFEFGNSLCFYDKTEGKSNFPKATSDLMMPTLHMKTNQGCHHTPGAVTSDVY